MSQAPKEHRERFEATRQSLVERLGNWEDKGRWQEFFDLYSRLIYSVARRSGLTDAESQDVVQETVISVARNIARYDRKAGSFKSWLLQMTRWRVADQFRKRMPDGPHSAPSDGTSRDTATIDRLPAPDADFESAWDDEWRQNLLQGAMERIKRKVSPKHFQIFDCAICKQWSASKIAAELGVNIAQVYLIKHRLSGMLKKELRHAEEGR